MGPVNNHKWMTGRLKDKKQKVFENVDVDAGWTMVAYLYYKLSNYPLAQVS